MSEVWSSSSCQASLKYLTWIKRGDYMGISGSWQNSLTFEKKYQSLCEISHLSSPGIAHFIHWE